MNLSDFCRRITGPDARLLPENHKLGARLICPEYSKSVQEVKTYPLLSQDRSFLLCWNFDSPGNLYATMMPDVYKRQGPSEPFTAEINKLTWR